jgi:type I restriction enzyme M protein
MSHSTFIIHNSSFAAGVGIPFETKMSEMSATLFQQMAEAAKLDATIRQNLKGLGYEE